jgi:hypothetical protein
MSARSRSSAANRDGIWRIEAHDNEGHKVQTEVTITSGAPATSHTDYGNRWLLWASLTLNIVALVSVVDIWRNRRRRQSAETSMEGIR